MLARFFKPNWQHAKPAKRIKAIARLNENLAEDQSIISRLAAQDLDDSVRLAAIEKLNNLSQLITISTHDPADQNRQQALHNVSQILLKSTSITLDEKCNALRTIGSHDLLIHLILNSNEEALRSQALEQLDNNAHLARVIKESQRAAIRLAATERLSCQETLETVNKEARNKDKGVFRASRDKLNDIREQQKLQSELQQNIEKLLASLQQLSQCQEATLYGAKFTAIQQEWETVERSASTDQRAQFNQHAALCLAFIKEQQQLEEKKAAAAALKEEQQQLSASLINSAHDLFQRMQTPAEAPETLAEHKQNAVHLASQWQQLTSSNTDIASKEIESDLSSIQQSLQAQEKLLSETDKVKALIDTLKEQLTHANAQDNAATPARSYLKKLQWPTTLSKPELLIELETLIEKSQIRKNKSKQKQQDKQQEFNALLDELANAIAQGEIKTADKHLKKAEQITKQLNEQLPSRLDQRLKQLSAELQEIRSWQSYAVTPKKEALCVAMEALCDSSLEIQELSNQIKKIQKDWKLLDATDSEHSQPLWKRFKKASDIAYAPCDKHFSEQRQLRLDNLKQREVICQQLTDMLQESQEENPDWKKIEENIRSIKQAWRVYTPVDRAPGKKIQKIFDQLISQLEEPIKVYRAENGSEKLRIVEQTEALLESNDLLSATSEVKKLQQQWKELGPASRNQERKLWTRFRENCSLIFDRFHASGEQASQQDVGVDHSLEGICSKLEQLQQSASSLELMEQVVAEVKKTLTTLKLEHSELPNDYLARIDLACNFVEQQKLELLKLLTEAYEALQRKAVLCEQLELSILEGGDEKQRLSIQSAWEQGPAIPEALGHAINARFATLMTLTTSPEQLEETVSEQEIRLRQLCIRLEIASSQPSPPEDQVLRMEYQMQRIQQALAQQEQAFSLAEIKMLEYEWLCVPFAGHFEELHQRFHTQLRRIF